MPGALSSGRAGAVRRRRVTRYLAYAAGEVALIFLGITLAVAFENANERKRSSELARGLLVAVQADLAANLIELDRNLSEDRAALAALEPLLLHFAARRPWHDSLAAPLAASFPWASPYVATSGYESLKQLGVHLVEAEHVRQAVVGLYEGTYARLEGDQNQAQWAFYENAFLPMRMRELEYVDPLGPRLLRMRDYAASLERGELVYVLAEHRAHMRNGLERKEEARQATERTIEILGDYLSAH